MDICTTTSLEFTMQEWSDLVFVISTHSYYRRSLSFAAPTWTPPAAQCAAVAPVWIDWWRARSRFWCIRTVKLKCCMFELQTVIPESNQPSQGPLTWFSSTFNHVTWFSSADGLCSVVMEMNLLYPSSAAVIISSTAPFRFIVQIVLQSYGWKFILDLGNSQCSLFSQSLQSHHTVVILYWDYFKFICSKQAGRMQLMNFTYISIQKQTH